jgi:hypothetical protein
MVTQLLFATLAMSFTISIFVANHASAPLAATATISNALTRWRIKFLMFPTVTVFLRFPIPSANSSALIGICSTVFFAAVSECIYRQFKGHTPAFICVLHTFGRDLKWNPHIHVLLAEGGADKFGNWRERNFFSYESLRKSFQTILLNLLHEKLGDSFKKVKAQIYKAADNGFYVNAPKSQGKVRNLINYIGRYLGRPVIAMSRIDHYDGKNVTFHYDRHDNGERVVETISAQDFIKRLVIHIPPAYFNMTRYFGLYANRNKTAVRVGKVIETRRNKLRFRELLLKTLGVDPQRCRNCGTMLQFLWLVHTANNEIRLERPHGPPKRTSSTSSNNASHSLLAV